MIIVVRLLKGEKSVDLEIVNDEVYYTKHAIFKISNEQVEELKKICLSNIRKRIRICTHRDVNDVQQEMLIVHTKDTYVRPHQHLGKDESIYIIEGCVDVIMFDEEGNMIDVINMGDYSTGLSFYYRINNAYLHAFVIKSDFLVFHEVTKGPFKLEDTIFAPWAPEDTDKVKVREYLKTLEKEARLFQNEQKDELAKENML